MLTLVLTTWGCGSGELVPTDADKAVALTATAVAPYRMLPGPIDPAKEKWSLAHAWDGEWSIEYDYADDKLVVNFTGVVEPKKDDVAWVYMGYGLGTTFVDGTDGVELVDAPGVLAWGDESECSFVRSSGMNLGFVCRGRHDARAFMVTAAGVTPEGEAAPGRLLAAPLAAFDQWNPGSIAR